MAWGYIGAAAITGTVGLITSHRNRKKAEGMADEAREQKRIENQALQKEKAAYKAMEFTNPFAGAQTKFENVFEDLTVNQQQAEFEAQQGAQQRANIMQNLRGAAGGSGIAALAQTLANQGALQTQQISASIGMQEARNQMAMARGAESARALEVSQENMVMQGDQWVQQAEMDRQATLLGMQMGQAAGANTAYQQAQANQMNAQIASQQVLMDTTASIGTSAADAMWKKKHG